MDGVVCAGDDVNANANRCSIIYFIFNLKENAHRPTSSWSRCQIIWNYWPKYYIKAKAKERERRKTEEEEITLS